MGSLPSLSFRRDNTEAYRRHNGNDFLTKEKTAKLTKFDDFLAGEKKQNTFLLYPFAFNKTALPK